MHSGESNFARLLRTWRKDHGLTLKTAAKRSNVSSQALWLLESRNHIPTLPIISAVLDGLRVHPWRRPAFLAQMPQQQLLNQLRWNLPKTVPPSDQVGLDQIGDPACYHDPGFDLYAANSLFLEVFPGLEPPQPETIGRSNLLTYVVTDPRAKIAIRNWRQRAAVMVDAFLTVAPGRIPEERFDEIVAVCEQAPEFAELRAFKATDSDIFDQTIILRNPRRGRYENRSVVAWTPKYPPRPWDILILQSTTDTDRDVEPLAP
jgi:transcriptional regulator with XRE-family HTH domain